MGILFDENVDAFVRNEEESENKLLDNAVENGDSQC